MENPYCSCGLTLRVGSGCRFAGGGEGEGQAGPQQGSDRRSEEEEDVRAVAPASPGGGGPEESELTRGGGGRRPAAPARLVPWPTCILLSSSPPRPRPPPSPLLLSLTLLSSQSLINPPFLLSHPLLPSFLSPNPASSTSSTLSSLPNPPPSQLPLAPLISAILSEVPLPTAVRGCGAAIRRGLEHAAHVPAEPLRAKVRARLAEALGTEAATGGGGGVGGGRGGVGGGDGGGGGGRGHGGGGEAAVALLAAVAAEAGMHAKCVAAIEAAAGKADGAAQAQEAELAVGGRTAILLTLSLHPDSNSFCRGERGAAERRQSRG